MENETSVKNFLLLWFLSYRENVSFKDYVKRKLAITIIAIII